MLLWPGLLMSGGGQGLTTATTHTSYKGLHCFMHMIDVCTQHEAWALEKNDVVCLCMYVCA